MAIGFESKWTVSVAALLCCVLFVTYLADSHLGPAHVGSASGFQVPYAPTLKTSWCPSNCTCLTSSASNTTRRPPVASFIINPQPNRKWPQTKIPQILHQTWKSYDVPLRLKPYVQSWRKYHPGWEYWYWTDKDMQCLVEQWFPEKLEVFNNYPKPVFRSDAFRYMVLYVHGGVYADLDFEALKPLDDIIDKHKVILSREPDEHVHFGYQYFYGMREKIIVSNALMASKPAHPFFKWVINDLNNLFNDFVIMATGPAFLTKQLSRWQHRWQRTYPQDVYGLYVAPAELFQPVPDKSKHWQWKRWLCANITKFPEFNEMHSWLCPRVMKEGFLQEPTEKSYTNHHLTHVWAKPEGVVLNDTFDIRTLT